jgi:DNA mismatch repair ATPase MutS
MAWLALPPFLFGSKTYKLILYTLPPLTLLALAGTLLFAALKPVVFGCVLVQWSIVGYHSKRIREFHEFISRKKIILEKYASLLSYLPLERFEAPVLKDLSGRALQADQKIRALSSLVSALNARLNAFATIVLNSLLMYDIMCVYRLERWKQENSDNLVAWLDVIQQTEVLCSLGTFAFNHPGFTFPSAGGDLNIRAQALGHPLIDARENVRNDVSIGERGRVFIITGANMAGKSTFLRAIGVNLVLAMSGSVVNATKMEFPMIGIRSGIRTTDSLKDHQSYFYAELERLKGIVDELRSGAPLLLLLDEILKGTNSTDKQTGSIALVQQLLHFNCLAFVATHDLALGKLADEFPEQVRNYRFEAIIEGEKLSFDYLLKEGLAQQMNATFLMKKMGIIPE